jgi:serine/threonine protein kinase
MPLSVGNKLGPYEIIAPLGKGGMGEVYRAKDTNLDREVAIKVLPNTLARDPDRLARFEREAKVLASLNHPNIATIYGLEECPEGKAIAMELVDGKTLTSPLPLTEVLRLASQIAEALETAHEKGITHRDLKPANIIVTPAGLVKVLDFGLAAVGPTTSQAREDSPTLTVGMTEAGVMMGTAGYMAPEQAVGKPVDRRADIWSFGVVLWEMLTGKRLFSGDTTAHILADVIRAEIDFGKLPESTPTPVRQLLKRCLDRDVKRRLQWIGEARIAIQEYLANPESGTERPTQAEAPTSTLLWIGMAMTTLIALALAIAYFRQAPPPERTLRYTISPPENSSVHSFAISPDAHYLAIAAAANGKRQLWLRPLDALETRPIPGTEDATYPFWSPDSRYIGFFAQGKLKKIAASGGPAQTLCDGDGRGGSWNREGVIVFSAPGSSIQRVAAAGGVAAAVTKAIGIHRNPVFLPDGRHFLYLDVGTEPEKKGVYFSSLDDAENRRILPDSSSAVFAPASFGRVGHLLFIRENTLMALPFDAGNLKIAGEVFPVADGVSSLSAASVGFAAITVSENGVLLFATGGSSQIVWFDRAGMRLSSVGASASGWEPSISPDQKALAFRGQTGATSDIWLRDLVRGADSRLTSNTSRNLDPFWSPKGDRVLFSSNRGGSFNLYQRAVGGSSEDESLVSNPNIKVPDQWTRDGRFVVYTESDPKTKWDLWVLSMSGDERKPIQFLHSQFNELYGQLSPDNRWMAYTSDESGQREVYVRRFPEGDSQVRISTAGGEQPRWRGDGKELFFVSLDGKITCVPMNVAPGPKRAIGVGAPVPLFETQILEGSGHVAFQYDVTADGKRFVVATASAAASATPLTVVVNWSAGLKK